MKKPLLLLLTNVIFPILLVAQNYNYKEVKLLPNGAPGSNAKNWPWESYHEEWRVDTGRNEKMVIWVTEPSLYIFKPEKNDKHIAVIVCPGGGYNILEIEKEGFKVAKALNELGITAVVLKYRHYNMFAALEDAHRAIQYVRSKFSELRVNKIGIGGFSAGGHLALHAAARQDNKKDWVLDEVDKLNQNPDFLMLIYPSPELPEGTKIDKTLPPVFLAVSADDFLYQSCFDFYGLLKKNEVPSEFHVYQKGGHGWGTGSKVCGCDTWTQLFSHWLEVIK